MTQKKDAPKKDIHYENNFIDRVVFRIDFSPILRISKDNPVEFQEEIRQKCPEAEKQIVTEIETSLKKGEEEIKRQQIPLWIFHNKEKSKKITLFQNHLLVEFFKYTHFDDYKPFILEIFKSFEKIYAPLSIKRIGLRYINRINFKTGNPLEWKDYINPTLTKILDDFIDSKEKGAISKALHQMGLNKDEYNIIFTFGMPNAEYPAKISRKEYILDFDCYTRDCEDIDIEATITQYNREIKDLFEKSILDGLREKMGVKK